MVDAGVPLHKLLLFVFVATLNASLAIAEQMFPVLAVSNVTHGPAQKLGQDLNDGAQLYFSQSSASPVDFKFENDGYEPEQAVINTKGFIENDYNLLVNFVGTPTSKAILNHILHLPVLLITPFTGADFLREPQAKHVFNLRASYQQEARFHTQYLIEQLGLKRVGIILQADDYGLSFTKYFEQELHNHNLSPILLPRVKRNSHYVTDSVQALITADIDVVVFIGTYAPLVEIIQQTFPHRPDLIYASVSFAASDHILPHIPHNAKVFFSEVVPDPNSCDFDECTLFRALASEKFERLTRGQFEGFINAMWLDSALKECHDVSLACISDNLAHRPQRLFGQEFSFSQESRQLANEVFYSVRNLQAPAF